MLLFYVAPYSQYIGIHFPYDKLHNMRIITPFVCNQSCFADRFMSVFYIKRNVQKC